MKKILLFVPTNGGTTIARLSLNLYKALSNRKGLEVKVALIYKYDNGIFDFGDSAYFSTSESRFKLLSHVKKVVWFLKLKKEFKPDITINTLFVCSIISVLSGGKDKKIGIFHSPHEQSGKNGKMGLLRSYFTYILIYSKLDKLFCVSQEIYDSIISKFRKIPKEKVQVVYNIHNIEEIVSRSNEEIDTEYSDLFQKKVLLYCGRLDKNKAPERLLQAFIAAIPMLPDDVRLVYMGADTDNLWNKMLLLSKENKVENRVSYIGVQNNPYQFIVSAFAVVSCSYSEGLPGVIIESLLLHTPVVSTNSSKGVWEIMSVFEDYDSNLENNYVNNYGIITPNRSLNNSDFASSDIHHLSLALIELFHREMKFEAFEFEKQISPEQIVDIFTK